MQGDEALSFNPVPGNTLFGAYDAQAAAKEICFYTFEFLFTVIWWILFKIFANDPVHFGSEKDCVILRSDCIGLVNYLVYLLALLLMVIVFTFFRNKFGNCMKLVDMLLKLFFGLYAIGVEVYYLVVITIDLTKEEPCGGLRVLSLVWVIIAYSSIAIVCCCCCLVCGCTLLVGLMRNNIQQH